MTLLELLKRLEWSGVAHGGSQPGHGVCPICREKSDSVDLPSGRRHPGKHKEDCALHAHIVRLTEDRLTPMENMSDAQRTGSTQT